MGLRMQCRCMLSNEVLDKEPCLALASAEDGFCDTCRGHFDGQVIPSINEKKHYQGTVSFNPHPVIVPDDDPRMSPLELKAFIAKESLLQEFSREDRMEPF